MMKMNPVEVRTSLEVGFTDGWLPEKFLRYRGKATRAIALKEEFPFEDAQFDVVLMDGSCVSRASVREAHRVLRPDGRLFFVVLEKTSRQDGYTQPDIYSIIRDGFHIVSLERSSWWFLKRTGRTLTIEARKKTWKSYKGLARTGSAVLTPFNSRK